MSKQSIKDVSANSEAAGLSKSERAHRTMQNQINSPLLRLPAELRNRIYEFALGVSRVEINSGGRVVYYEPTLHPHAFALLNVSRQIHSEAKLLPFSRKVFLFHHGDCIDSFTSCLTPTQVRAIRVVEVYASPRRKSLSRYLDLFHDQVALLLTHYEGLQKVLFGYTPSHVGAPVTFGNEMERFEEDQCRDVAKLFRERYPGISVIVRNYGRDMFGDTYREYR